jgi:N-acetylglucosamine-6-sulfatase
MSRTRGLVLLAAALATVATLPSQAEAAKRPNIVVVTTDDQTLASLRPDTMPNVTRLLAGKGTTFTDAIVTTPLCCPSRATWITGQYAHNHGVTSNGLGYAALEDKANTLPVWLDRAGYKTAHVGKYLNGYEGAVGTPTEVAPGWNIWFTTLGSTRYYDYDVSANGRPRHFQEHDNDYVTRVINRKAKSLIGRTTPLRAPLYLQVDHRAPHTETGIETRGGCSGRTVPDPDDKQLYKSEALPQPLSFNEADVSDKPGFVQSRIPIDVNRLKKLTKRYTCALASLRAVDRGVEKIVKALKDAGELDKTVIVFTSDNGYYYGEHRIPVGKIYPYEEGIRVPLIMRVPEQYRGGGERIAEIGCSAETIRRSRTTVHLSPSTTSEARAAARTACAGTPACASPAPSTSSTRSRAIPPTGATRLPYPSSTTSPTTRSSSRTSPAGRPRAASSPGLQAGSTGSGTAPASPAATSRSKANRSANSYSTVIVPIMPCSA